MMQNHIVLENGAVIAAAGADAPVPWWSFTKTVIAAAALVLVARGRLALDEPLPGQTYTLRQLLQHRAGLGDYGGVKAYHDAVARGDEPWPVPLLLKRAAAQQLKFVPGEGWTYSNIGYLFVRHMVEQTAGDEFGAALRDLVLRPLGIDGARFARDPEDLGGVLMGTADKYHPGWVYHGLVVGPLRAAARLLDRLMAGHLLPPELLDAMCQPHMIGTEVPGRPWRSHGYGLGLMIGTTAAGDTVLGHTGGGPGSVVAIYHARAAKPRRTAAAFRPGDDQGRVEAFAFEGLRA